MTSRHSLALEQKQKLRLTQQQLKYVTLLDCNAQELEEAVEQAVEDNPALEAEDNDADNNELSRSGFIPSPQSQSSREVFDFTPPDLEESLYDSLYAQLSEKQLPDVIAEAARFIIGSLDTNGYMTRSLHEIVNDLYFNEGIEITEQQARLALDAVKELDPPGVGASSLREALLLQLDRKRPSETLSIAKKILEDHYDAFTKKHSHRILSGLKITQHQYDEAIDLIRSLNPKPGSSVGSENSRANVIVPDFIVSNYDGELTIALNNRIPELRIDQSFESAMAEMKKQERSRRQGQEFVISRYREADEFIKILSQRQQTMMTVMTAIVNLQKEYFLSGDVYDLKPMSLKDVSSATGLDLSIVSRCTANKYVSTPSGTFPLRFFFSGSKGENSGELVTNREVEAELRSIIENEDKRHPLSDEKLQEEMSARGYALKRRTIAKYRDRIGFPVARLRKTH